MNIFQTSTAFYPSMGGAQLHWFTIGKMLVERGHTVTGCGQWKDHRNRYLIDSTLKAPWGDDKYEAGPITVHRYQPSALARAWMAPFLPFCLPLPEVGYPLISRYFAKKMAGLPGKPDIVVNIRIGREHFSWASYYLAKKHGVPFVICPNYSPRMQSKFGQFVMRNFFRLLRAADGVVVFTPAERDEMIRLGVKEKNILLIGVGPLLAEKWDTAAFRKDYGVKEKMVLFLGQKLEYKGFDTLIEAAPKVWEKHPETSFVFIGPHYPGTQEVFDKIDDPRIIDIPRIDAFDSIKVAALDAANVFALPSRQEGIGGVYIEAWALKKPVISCKIPFLTIRDGVDGVMVEQDAEILAGKLVWFLDHPK
ncbi:glycosyltransferase family 4 protein, partial [Akkermansiaceae bacterium]|nr:glycosyltransferase family 4 protein [Akkermansiaceae bacterium]